MNVKAIPASTSYFLKKVKFGVKNEAERFYQMKDHYFVFLYGETQFSRKLKTFYQTLSLGRS